MAVSVEKWFCEELSKFGIDATEENAQYILSMGDAEDLQEYMLNLLDGTDPKVQDFLPRLMDRWCSVGGRTPPNITMYKKDDGDQQVYVQPRKGGRKKRGKNRSSGATTTTTTATTTTPQPTASAGGGSTMDHSASLTATTEQPDRQGEEVTVDGGGPPSSSLSSLSSSIVNEISTSAAVSSFLASPQAMQNGEVGESGGVSFTAEQHGGARKKSKFVPLYSQQGKEKLVITLPGRTQCECQALKHELINNCMSCGRVVCRQEGAGPCLFCGNLVCTPEDQEVLNRGSKKSEKLRQHLMRDADKFTPLCRRGVGGRGGGEEEEDGGRGRKVELPSVSARLQEGFERAVRHKERLLEFDRTSVRRTQVIDDECDYFATDSNQWLNQHEREALRKREEELRSARFASRKDRKMTLDFAGRQVMMEDGSEVGRTMYDHMDSVVQDVQYGKKRGQQTGAGKGDQQGGARVEQEEGGGYLINPTIVQPAPQFVPSKDRNKSSRPTPPPGGSSSRPGGKGVGVIQDRELREMSDEGWCLSMHQPWASLLVAGIKIHEGRSWYTAHRGRLWIAATAKTPTSDEISEMERHYRFQNENGEVDFPADYPSGCLLGCVDLVDCLSQEDYRQQFPDGESACPYVFICENPQQLLIKFPIKGKHKIYKLDATIHQAARKGLR